MGDREETLEEKRKRLLEEWGMMTIPIGGLSNLSPYERRRGLRRR